MGEFPGQPEKSLCGPDVFMLKILCDLQIRLVSVIDLETVIRLLSPIELY